MRMHLTFVRVLAVFALALTLAAVPAPAATITGTTTNLSTVTSFDLTSLGHDDWAYWNTTAASGHSGAPTNEKNGASLINSMSIVGSGTLRGSSSSSQPRASYSFTNGTSPASGSVAQATGLFSTVLDTNGVGVKFTITLPTVDTYIVNVWAGVFGGTATFTASMTGATSFTNAFTAANLTPKPTNQYRLFVTPDNANDVLTISMVMTADNTTQGSSQAFITGAAVTGIPTPAALPAGLTLLSLVGLRRRGRMHA
ncbi:MAG: hypothetical protein GC162_02695 [Planctomycetes bacterium]|nr:hypothetical protein [Planctomycetota bacterium]